MFIFRIISNLIRLALNLVLLPIRLLTRSFFGIILLVALGYLFLNSKQGSHGSRPSAPIFPTHSASSGVKTATVPTEEEENPGGQPVVIDPVRVIEDGNSSFSTDLMQLMDSFERIHYSQNFYSAMDTLNAKQERTWVHKNIAGKFTITETFQNKRKQTCKRFKEVLKVHEIQQTLDAMACQRDQGGWCKLRPSSTPGCGLGQAPSTLRDIGRSVNNLF